MKINIDKEIITYGDLIRALFPDGKTYQMPRDLISHTFNGCTITMSRDKWTSIYKTQSESIEV